MTLSTTAHRAPSRSRQKVLRSFIRRASSVMAATERSTVKASWRAISRLYTR
jgi:hypothetical protein